MTTGYYDSCWRKPGTERARVAQIAGRLAAAEVQADILQAQMDMARQASTLLCGIRASVAGDNLRAVRA